jgi:hypothetical protein
LSATQRDGQLQLTASGSWTAPHAAEVETLAEALAEGIMTGHPAMPHFTFHPREIDALLTYIDSLTPLREPRVRKR